MGMTFRRCVAKITIALAAPTGCRIQPAPAPVVTQPPPPPREAGPRAIVWTQGPLASTQAAPGELSGLVLDDVTGQPIAYAQISFRALTADVSDSSGRFRMTLGEGIGSLRVLRIGYQRNSVPFAAHRDTGYVAVFALRKAEVILCNVSVGSFAPTPSRAPGVVVHVLDAHTGLPPAGVVTLLARDGAFQDSVATRADSGRDVTLNAAFDRHGRYDVTVRSAGYHDWEGHGTTWALTECSGELQPAFFRVWLIPK